MRSYERERYRDASKRGIVKKKIKRKAEDRIEYDRKARKNNPEKFKARSAVKRAVKKGTLKRQPCEVCGEIKSQAHHDDYNKPLDIRWLCSKHHGEVHRKF